MKTKLSKLLSLLLAFTVFTNIWNTAFSVSASERLDEIPSTYSEEFIPVYTADDLYNIRNNLDGNYRLMNDIDLTEATAKGGDLDYMGCGWLPIGMSNSGTTREHFTGIFDGGNYTIKGMRIETNDNISGGLFLWVSGEIRNLNMIGGEIKVEDGVIGSIAAANRGSIENCHVEITIDTSASMVGGIVGANYGTISNCSNTANISLFTSHSQDSFVGGIAGVNYKTTQKCYNTGHISIEGKNFAAYAGGITGSNTKTASISNCYNTGNIRSIADPSGTSYDDYGTLARASGIAGRNIGSIYNCYNIGQTYAEQYHRYGANGAANYGLASAISYKEGSVNGCCYLSGTGNGVPGARAATEEQMRVPNTYQYFDFGNTWTFNSHEGYQYPQLRDNMQTSGANLHDFGDWQVRIPATCIKEGEEYRTCACGAEETRVVEPLGHSFTEYIPDNNATCIENETETAKCDRCDATDTHVIENSALGHSYSYDWTVDEEPTCTAPGSKSHHCTRCGDKRDVTEIKALGHSFTKYIYDNNATCTDNGTETAKCDRCDATDTHVIENSALGHSYSSDWTVDEEPTCTVPGSKSHHCTRCGDKRDVTEIKALGHSFTKYIYDNNATCTDNGTETAKCDRCDATDTRVKEDSAKGHTFSDWQVRTPATCSKKGLEYRTCSDCGKEETREIAALGHSFREWIVEKQASMTEDGLESRICSVCGEKESRIIPALGFPTGDLNEDGKVTDADAIHLLYHTLLPDLYPINQRADYNGDGIMLYTCLLWY